MVNPTNFYLWQAYLVQRPCGVIRGPLQEPGRTRQRVILMSYVM